MSTPDELQEEIDMLRWELASGAFAGCTDTQLDNIHNQLTALEEELEELQQ